MVRDARRGMELIGKHQRLSDRIEREIDRTIDYDYLPSFRNQVRVVYLRFGRGIPTKVQFNIENKYKRFGWDSVEFKGKGRGIWRIILTPSQSR